MQCRTLVAQLGRLSKQFQAAGAEVLVVLGDTPEHAQRYVEQLKTPFPVLSDPERAIYHRYGLDKALVVIQRTASVVVDRNGVIQYIKTSTSPMLWLKESGELLKFVTGMGGRTGRDQTAGS